MDRAINYLLIIITMYFGTAYTMDLFSYHGTPDPWAECNYANREQTEMPHSLDINFTLVTCAKCVTKATWQLTANRDRAIKAALHCINIMVFITVLLFPLTTLKGPSRLKWIDASTLGHYNHSKMGNTNVERWLRQASHALHFSFVSLRVMLWNSLGKL